MLGAATAVQGLELLVPLAVVAAAGISGAEQVCMLGRLTDGTLATTYVTYWDLTCEMTCHVQCCAGTFDCGVGCDFMRGIIQC